MSIGECRVERTLKWSWNEIDITVDSDGDLTVSCLEEDIFNVHELSSFIELVKSEHAKVVELLKGGSDKGTELYGG